MLARCDVVVIGAGHNGLVAAAYLARAGLSVLVVERSSGVGGTVVTDEIAPGFRASMGFPSAETLHSIVVKELRLVEAGLDLLPTSGTAVRGEDGRWLAFAGDGRVIEATAAAMGADGAAALDEFERLTARIAATLEPLYTEPLPDLETLDSRDRLDLLRVGWRLRRLGRRDMLEGMRLLPMAIRDAAEERFTGGLLRAAVAAQGFRGTWLGPYSAGSTFALVHHRIGRRGKLLSGPVHARGGMGAVAEALAEAARRAGAEIRTDTEAVVIVADGRRTGVVVGDGDEIVARAVVSGADPRRTFLALLDPAAMTPEFLAAARGIRARAGVAIIGFALDALPESGPHDTVGASILGGRVQIGPTVDYLERAFDAGQRGLIPDRPFVELSFPSVADPTLAPEGKHVATAWVQTIPYRLTPENGEPSGANVESAPDDGWNGGRERLADAVTAVLDEALPGFADRVVSRSIAAPPDLETRFAATNGCLYDLDLSLDQALYLRPLAEWAQYRAPLRGVYLCGSGSHAGGGIRGTAGRNAATRVLDDLKSGRLR